MIIEKTLNIWMLPPKTWRCITTNGTITNDGHCVMGRGNALQAKQKYPGIEYEIGAFLKQWGNYPMVLDDYHLVTFPTKHNWWEHADLELIGKSAVLLIDFLNNGRVTAPVYLPFPGIGNGHLQKKVVRRVLDPILDDRVVLVTI